MTDALIKFADIIRYSKGLSHQIKFGESLDELLNSVGNISVQDINDRINIWRNKSEPVATIAAETTPTDPTIVRARAIKALREECQKQRLSLEQTAYVMATAEHETNDTFEPVEEAYYMGDRQEAYLRSLDYYPYYGRGLVQLTWQSNYARYQEILNIPLLEQPKLALKEDVSRFIIVHGMINGNFTGWRLIDWINGDRKDYVNARRIINGLDRAEEIAAIAELWEEFLKANPLQ